MRLLIDKDAERPPFIDNGVAEAPEKGCAKGCPAKRWSDLQAPRLEAFAIIHAAGSTAKGYILDQFFDLIFL